MFFLNIFKNFLFLKILFALLSGCLLIQEFINFIFVKPTYTSTSRTSIQPHQYPDILVCPFLGFDQRKLIEAGYWTSYDYFLGEMIESGGSGWKGNSSKSAILDVVNNITVIRSSKDCPVLKVKLMKKDRKIIKKVLNMKPSQISHPAGRCCHGLMPEEANSTVIFSALIQMMVSQDVNITQYRVHLSDQLSTTFFHRDKFNTYGPRLKFSKDNLGYHTYRIQIHEERHIQDENLVSCLTYPKPGEFHECLERDFLKQNSKFLNCSPPWMTETVDLWCRGKMNITKNAEEFVKIWR